MREASGRWIPGQLPAGVKRHGLSGPINDFQFDRFMFVYGTDAGTAGFSVTARGWFDALWQWDSALCLQARVAAP